MKKTLLTFALIAMLTACASMDTQTKRIETACAGSSAAIKALAAARTAGKLDAPTIASVDKAISVVRPVCNPGTATPPTLDTLKEAAFVGAVDELTARAARLGN